MKLLDVEVGGDGDQDACEVSEGYMVVVLDAGWTVEGQVLLVIMC